MPVKNMPLYFLMYFCSAVSKSLPPQRYDLQVRSHMRAGMCANAQSRSWRPAGAESATDVLLPLLLPEKMAPYLKHRAV